MVCLFGRLSTKPARRVGERPSNFGFDQQGHASREFKAGKNQNQLSEENIKKIVKTYRDGDNVEKYAYLASLKEIQDNDYNLNIPRYVDTFEEEDEIDLLAVRAEREQLKAELAKLETEMAGYLKELGYGS
ncbi:hypothetical protein AN694_0223695 [Serratia marcescens]|uniref:site-specific DNA-methyltransferase (adenine-specific) n=1 Tax=Serratia marcescens TaxID=615 RepID=A0A2F0P808_SERMA|nr:hypothetical protein AN694_0223695 [Serratia marcescens]OCO80208.1 hypothetical protein AN695_0225180 [Serratia marcescens]